MNKLQNKPKKILIIAGSDPCGGAGIQTDIKTATAHKIYASSVITCLTSQNTQKVNAIHNPPIEFLQDQLETVLDDIEFDVIKIGMLGNSKIINCVAKVLENKAKNVPIILDTVMVATSGDLLLDSAAVADLKTFISQAHIVTPNIDEAQILADMTISNVSDMKKAALKIKALGCNNVLIKGGHLKSENSHIINLLLCGDDFTIIKNRKVNIDNIHGTGCSLASAIACNLAQESDVTLAVRKANRYMGNMIAKSVKIGKGSNVLLHS